LNAMLFLFIVYLFILLGLALVPFVSLRSCQYMLLIWSQRCVYSDKAIDWSPKIVFENRRATTQRGTAVRSHTAAQRSAHRSSSSSSAPKLQPASRASGVQHASIQRTAPHRRQRRAKRTSTLTAADTPSKAKHAHNPHLDGKRLVTRCASAAALSRVRTSADIGCAPATAAWKTRGSQWHDDG
jgi:hypothetical protein